MKRINSLLIIYVLGFVCFTSCNHTEKSPHIVIDLENTITKKGSDELKLNDISEKIRLIPIETNDSTLLSAVHIIAGTTEERVIIYDKQTVYFINKEDGKVLSTINRYGEGPEEYGLIMDVCLDKQKNTLYIYDPTKKSAKEYTVSGEFVKSIKNDSIGIFRILNDGHFAVSFPPYLNKDFALGIYDNSWNLLRKGIPKKKDRNFAMLYFDNIVEFNNEYYYKLTFSDTLYRISLEFDEPYLIVSKGKYKLPEELAASLSELDKHGDKYVQQDYGYLISNYYFQTYYYDRKAYYEIWNTENSALIYKSTYGQEGGIKGIPIVIEGKEICVWPGYVSGDFLYCFIEDEDAVSLVPSLPSDTNPIILEVKIK
jgi:hypothetical protein